MQISNAAMMCMTGRILGEKIDVLRLTFYTAPVSSACLLPVFCIREARHPHHLSLRSGYLAVECTHHICCRHCTRDQA